MSAFSLRLFDTEEAAPSERDLLEFFRAVYLPWHPELEETTRAEYLSQIKKFSRWLAEGPDILKSRQPKARYRPTPLSALAEDNLLRYQVDILNHQCGSNPKASARKARSTLLTLWACAYQRDELEDPPAYEIPVVELPKPAPQAWRLEDVEKLLAVARRAKPLRKVTAGRVKSWDGRHWVALLLVIYDTSLRVSAAVSVTVVQVDFARGVLHTAAESQKHDCDETYRLDPGTLAALAEICAEKAPADLVFDWPFVKRQLWKRYDQLLVKAGMPHSGRHKFHMIRRTSYTYTAAKLGLEEAGRHAGHASDLRRYYLDERLYRELKGTPEPATSIPRPAIPTVVRQTTLPLAFDPDPAAPPAAADAAQPEP
jgi:integrase